MKNNFYHILIALVLLALLTLLTDPFMAFMPGMTAMVVLLCATVLACVWATFVIAEQAHDEREEQHRTSSGRLAYIAGVLSLTLALLVEGLGHRIDPWIAVALAAMIVVKLGSRLYSEHFK